MCREEESHQSLLPSSHWRAGTITTMSVWSMVSASRSRSSQAIQTLQIQAVPNPITGAIPPNVIKIWTRSVQRSLRSATQPVRLLPVAVLVKSLELISTVVMVPTIDQRLASQLIGHLTIQPCSNRLVQMLTAMLMTIIAVPFSAKRLTTILSSVRETLNRSWIVSLNKFNICNFKYFWWRFIFILCGGGLLMHSSSHCLKMLIFKMVCIICFLSTILMFLFTITLQDQKLEIGIIKNN